MLSLEDIRFFEAIARSNSLAAAARALDVSPPAVTQRLKLLEEKLGAKLVDRSPRRLRLTDEGEVLARGGRGVLANVDELSETLAARRGAVVGHLRVVAPFGFGRRFAAPAVAAFKAAHPDATATLTLSDNPHRQPTESWDVLIHIGELPDSSLISHRLAPNDRIICTSEKYLQRCGAPQSPEQLRRHACLVLRENDEDVTLWRFSSQGSSWTTVRIEPAMASNDGEVVRKWAQDGMGLAVRSEWDVADDLKSGRLIRVLTNWRLPSANVTALTAERSRRTARVSRFLDLLRNSLSPTPWRT